MLYDVVPELDKRYTPEWYCLPLRGAGAVQITNNYLAQ